MLRVGLTGGIACGKTLVRREFERLGAATLDADDLARHAVLPGRSAHQSIVEEFGEGVLREDSTLDRKALGEIVFSNPERRAKLNSIVHPEVRRLRDRWLEELGEQGNSDLAIVDAALLIETGSYRDLDLLVVVSCRPEQQAERMMQRDGLSRSQAQARLDSQMPISEKVRYADFVIDNSGAREKTLDQTREVFDQLMTRVRG